MLRLVLTLLQSKGVRTELGFVGFGAAGLCFLGVDGLFSGSELSSSKSRCSNAEDTICGNRGHSRATKLATLSSYVVSLSYISMEEDGLNVAL